MDIKKTAKEIVDKLVEEDGLDVGAVMHRSIEKRIENALENQKKELESKLGK